jgi:hypothetical protein
MSFLKHLCSSMSRKLSNAKIDRFSTAAGVLAFAKAFIWRAGVIGVPLFSSAVFAQSENGQTMTGTYKPATMSNGNVGSLSIQFEDTANATMTLPDGRQLPVTRFRF